MYDAGMRTTLAQTCFDRLATHFSNSLIIHAALTQPEHRILVRWMGLETP